METNVEYYPALQAQMGDWVYYVLTMRLDDLQHRVKRIEDIHETKGLKTWLQRPLAPARLEQISDYLRSQSQRFFSAIVVGIYSGDVEWFPVVVSKGVLHSDVVLSKRVKSAFGIIRLTGTEEMFPIDGQHRVEGIKSALQDDTDESAQEDGLNKLADDEQTVILVSHRTDALGHQRTRRLFFTLNRYAKRVSQGELIALSEDDTFAVVTRKLSEEYYGLDEEHVPLQKSPNINSTEKNILLSVITLYDVIRGLTYPPGTRIPTRLKTGPAPVSDIQRIYEKSVEFWDALKELVPAIRDVLESPPNKGKAQKYRHADGGHFLFRPLGLKQFAEVVGILHARDIPIKDAMRRCLQAPMELSDAPWRDVIWNVKKKKIDKGDNVLMRNILLRYAGAVSMPSGYDLETEYEQVVKNPFPLLRPSKSFRLKRP